MKQWLAKTPQWHNLQAGLPLLLLVLIVYLCWRLASLLWLVVAPVQPLHIDSVQLGSQQRQIPNIQSFALFNEQNNLNAADFSQFKLRGVMLSTPAHLSSAVIQMEQTSERYRVGQMLGATGYQLHSVFWDRVVLSQANGARQELSFDKMPDGLDQSLPTTAVTAPENVPATSEPPPILYSPEKTEVDNAIGKLGQQREQYMQEMGIKNNNGGFEVGQNMPAQLQQKLGLRQGDKILSLNGNVVNNAQNEAQILEQVQRQGHVQLEIQRGNQVITIQQDL